MGLWTDLEINHVANISYASVWNIKPCCPYGCFLNFSFQQLQSWKHTWQNLEALSAFGTCLCCWCPPAVNSGAEYSLSCCGGAALHCVKAASQQGDDKLMAKDNAHTSLWHKRASSLVPPSHRVTISMFRLHSLDVRFQIVWKDVSRNMQNSLTAKTKMQNWAPQTEASTLFYCSLFLCSAFLLQFSISIHQIARETNSSHVHVLNLMGFTYDVSSKTLRGTFFFLYSVHFWWNNQGRH